MKIGIVQLDQVWEDKAANKEKILNLVEKIEQNTDVLIFPEMTLTGFTMNTKNVGEEIDEASIIFFLELSRKLKTNIFAGIVEKDNNYFYNSLFHFDKNGLIKAVYRKIHPFTLGNEHKHFISGNEIVTSNIELHKIGLSICYDLRFPELYRFYAKEKAEIIINIANWPLKRIEHWQYLLKARAIENQCYMIGVNRIGKDICNDYNGSSAVYGPLGEKLLLAENSEQIFYINLDFEKVKEVRKKFGFLDDIKLI
ncbi:MAG: hypothetical protein CR986_05620 [Ignavibacteriae bacterium]|nr:MAG: hypothetical protein CR986_05620 [Ignavibacteriota bacterium]